MTRDVMAFLLPSRFPKLFRGASTKLRCYDTFRRPVAGSGRLFHRSSATT